MANLKLSGDTSGVITVAAPASAGTNTLTLPAATGTVALTANITTAVPSQTGNSGKYLTTNGSATSWGAAGTPFSTDILVNGLTVGKGLAGVATNTVLGVGALDANTSGSLNVAIGYNALTANLGGSQNIAVGRNAAAATTTAVANTAIGTSALSGAITTGGGTAVGGDSLKTTTGTNNTAIGYGAGQTLTTGTNNTLIGYAAAPSAVAVSNEMTLGNSSVTTLRCNDTSISSLSDARDKTNVQDIPLGLDFVNQMRPVSFDWDRRDGSYKGKKDFGFIAQELKEIQDNTAYADHMRLVGDNNPEKLEADPMKTYPVLVKAIQELSAKVEELQTEIKTLK